MSHLEDLLRRRGQERVLAPGEVLFQQGADSDGVYFVTSGWLGVYRDEQDGSYLLSIIAPGEMVGEMGASTGRPRAATVVASKETRVVYLSNEDFNRALRESPALAAEVIGSVGGRLTEADVMRIALGHSYRQAVDRVELLTGQAARLEELIRLREELAAMLVHDLRNPLGVISTGLEMLKQVQIPGEEGEYVASIVDTLNRSALRMQRLVDTLLDIARMEEERMALRPAPLSLRELVEERVEEERPLAARLCISLECSLPGDLPVVRADRYVIQRVLANLLDNALKFTPRGGRVTVTARPVGDVVEVAVTDTGPGIPPEERERIFEKFTQLPGQGGDRRGVGLGLAFCRMAVEAHGGQVWVEDGPDGRGSRFVFTLPVATDRL